MNSHQPNRIRVSTSGKVISLCASAAILWCASALGQSQPAASPGPNALSPDKKWQYVGGDAPSIVQADGGKAALDFSPECRPEESPDNVALLWAPDSKRLAFYCGQGKQRLTLLYQLRDQTWEPLETPGEGDAVMERAGDIIDGQAKKKGLPKGAFLHMQWWTVEPVRWLDAATLTLHASMGEVGHSKDGQYVGPSFATDLLVTLAFDDEGQWKMAKTRQLSARESKKFEH